jgi:hypothetical protein
MEKEKGGSGFGDPDEDKRNEDDRIRHYTVARGRAAKAARIQALGLDQPPEFALRDGSLSKKVICVDVSRVSNLNAHCVDSSSMRNIQLAKV